MQRRNAAAKRRTSPFTFAATRALACCLDNLTAFADRCSTHYCGNFNLGMPSPGHHPAITRPYFAESAGLKP